MLKELEQLLESSLQDDEGAATVSRECWDKTMQCLDLLGAAAQRLGDAHNDPQDKIHAAMGLTDERFLQAERGLQFLYCNTGEPPADAEGEIVWGALSSVADIIETLEADGLDPHLQDPGSGQTAGSQP